MFRPVFSFTLLLHLAFMLLHLPFPSSRDLLLQGLLLMYTTSES